MFSHPSAHDLANWGNNLNFPEYSRHHDTTRVYRRSTTDGDSKLAFECFNPSTYLKLVSRSQTRCVNKTVVVDQYLYTRQSLFQDVWSDLVEPRHTVVGHFGTRIIPHLAELPS
jgi:hypothetical protein